MTVEYDPALRLPTQRLTRHQKLQFRAYVQLARSVGWEWVALADALVAAHERNSLSEVDAFEIDAILTHQRCLIEFFGVRGGVNKDKDIRAEWLVPSWRGTTMMSKVDRRLLQDALDHIDKTLSHVSFSRTFLLRKGVDVAPVSRVLFEGCQSLVTTMDTESLVFRCLAPYLATATARLSDGGVDLSQPLEVRPAATFFVLTPYGYNEGFMAATVLASDMYEPVPSEPTDGSVGSEVTVALDEAAASTQPGSSITPPAPVQ